MPTSTSAERCARWLSSLDPELSGDDALIGAIEILSFESELSQAQLNDLGAVAEVFSAALYGAQIYENEHHNTLESISRLTQLYDIEKVFSSTLEMDQLFPIIGSKVREMLECEAVNLWLLEADESLRLMHQSGDDFTVRVGALQRPGEGVAGDVSDNGEAVLIEHSDDERLRAAESWSRRTPAKTKVRPIRVA